MKILLVVSCVLLFSANVNCATVAEVQEPEFVVETIASPSSMGAVQTLWGTRDVERDDVRTNEVTSGIGGNTQSNHGEETENNLITSGKTGTAQNSPGEETENNGITSGNIGTAQINAGEDTENNVVTSGNSSPVTNVLEKPLGGTLVIEQPQSVVDAKSVLSTKDTTLGVVQTLWGQRGAEIDDVETSGNNVTSKNRTVQDDPGEAAEDNNVPQSTAEPSQSTPESIQSTPEPSQSMAEPSQSMAEPSQSTSASIQSTAEPNQSMADPSQSTPESIQSTAEPSQSTPESIQSTAEPSQSTPESIQSTAEPSQSTSESIQSTPEPSQSTPESIQSTTEPSQSTAESIQSTTEPSQSTAESIQSTTEPSQSTAESIQSTTEPSQSTPESITTTAESKQNTVESIQTTAKPTASLTNLTASQDASARDDIERLGQNPAQSDTTTSKNTAQSSSSQTPGVIFRNNLFGIGEPKGPIGGLIGHWLTRPRSPCFGSRRCLLNIYVRCLRILKKKRGVKITKGLRIRLAKRIMYGRQRIGQKMNKWSSRSTILRKLLLRKLGSLRFFSRSFLRGKSNKQSKKFNQMKLLLSMFDSGEIDD